MNGGCKRPILIFILGTILIIGGVTAGTLAILPEIENLYKALN